MNAGRKKRIKSIIAVCLMVLLLGTMMPEGKKAAAEEMNANFLKEVQAHNVTENADYTLQHSKGRGISQNLRTFTYQPPEVSISYEFSNVAEMKAADFAALGIAEGDYVRTEGYYSAGDGGGGVYRIQNDVIIRDDGEKILDDGGQIIACEHQLNKKNMRAALQTQDGIISAAQYGAVGDGKTDDSEALEKAFSSNFSVIYLEKGKEYQVAPRPRGGRPGWGSAVGRAATAQLITSCWESLSPARGDSPGGQAHSPSAGASVSKMNFGERAR